MTFGETIKTVRARKGISQKELAKICGTSQQYINKLEHDTCIPRPKTIAMIIQALDAADDFISFIPEDTNTAIGETIRLCYGLSPKGLAKVNKYIRNNILNDPENCISETNAEN